MIFSSVSNTALPDLTGCTVGDRYTLSRKIRESATGAVYAAADRHALSDVALKLLSPQLLQYPGYRERFEREVRNAAALSHPNVCRVLDSGAVRIAAKDGSTVETVFLSYPLMAGGSLAERLADISTVPLSRISQWIDSLARALEHAHRRDVVHGDLKPSAIVFDEDDNLFVSDFAIGHTTREREQGHPKMGSPPYMSPEQWEEEIATPAADQFAVAAIAYYLVTGCRPFEGQDNPEIRRKNFSRGPIPAHKEARDHGRADVARAVSDVLARALSVSPGDRFSTIGEFSRALKKAIGGIDDSREVFLSYHRKVSAAWANLIAEKLRDKYGVSVFLDVTQIDGTGEFPDRIAEAIKACRVFVCLLGKRTLTSKWVKHEIMLAHQFGKPMISVRQEGFRDSAVQQDEALRALILSPGVYLFDVKNIYYEAAIEHLATTVAAVLKQGSDQ